MEIEKSQWLDAIIDSSFDGLWICDKNLRVIRINKASARINEVDAADVVGRNIMELVAEGVFDKSVTAEVLKKKTSVTMLQTVRGKKKILVTGNPIFDETGEISYIVTNDRDITELDRLRNQLQETQELVRGYASKLSELEFSGFDLSSMVVKSPESQRTIQVAIRCARADSTVLVLGESGVGKGMLAKLIHRNSDRAGGPFIRVDCPGIPEPLIESELFGYEKGAFTGAKNEGKPGLFELANRGTLFLDEISEISLGIQSKLLRFLEDRESLRVGGTRPRQVDARVVAATNQDIEEMVDRKQFRKDLYYRLNVVPIRILPLRERREDILPLILHFLEKFNAANHKSASLSPDAIDALCSYEYPGNVRELANILEQIVVVSERNRIESDALPFDVRSRFVLSRDGAHTPNEYSLREAIKKYEMDLLARAVQQYGSQREAARALGVSQGTISRKIRKRDDA
jgi:PAS domain S-box-containing protein/TyrR family helix-turn-helix protein